MSTQLPDKCPICGSYLFSDDDIVYCPDCGAPHHRDCWNAVGHCGLLKDHGSENEYKPHKSEEESKDKGDSKITFTADLKNDRENDCENDRENGHENFSESEKGTSFGKREREDDDGTHSCPFCGRSIPNNAQFCPYCGRAEITSETAQSPFDIFGAIHADPFGGIDANASIEGVSVRKIASFVSYAPNRMLPIFKRFETSKKHTSWNWVAFISPFVQSFFRKMNLHSFLYFLVDIIGCVLLSPLYNTVLNIDFPVNTTSQQMLSTLMNNPQKYFTVDTLVLAALGLLVLLVSRIFAGLYNDYFYKNHVITTIKAVEKDLDADEEEELQKRGGTRPFLALLLFMLVIYFGNYVPSFIAQLLFS